MMLTSFIHIHIISKQHAMHYVFTCKSLTHQWCWGLNSEVPTTAQGKGGFKFMEAINTFLTVQFTQASIVWGIISPYIIHYTKAGIELLIDNGGVLLNECVCYLLASSVSIVTDNVLGDRKLITIRQRILFLCHYFQTSSGIHSVSYPEGKLVNQSGHKVHHSLNFDAKVKNKWNCDSPLQYNLIEWRLSKHIHSMEGEHIHRRQENKWKDSVN